MRIACLLDNDFEDSEYRKPHEALRASGHDVVVIGFEAGALLRGKLGEERVVVVDGNLVTSRQPGDLDAFSRASVSVLGHASASRAY